MLLSVPVVVSRSGAKPAGDDSHSVVTDGWDRAQRRAESFYESEDKLERILAFTRDNPHLFATGLITGLASGTLGIGGGVVMTTLLGNWPQREMRQHEAVATSLLAMVPTGLAATTTNLASGTVAVRAGVILAISASAGMFVTARYLAPHIDETKMRYVFAGVMGVSAIRMLV